LCKVFANGNLIDECSGQQLFEDSKLEIVRRLKIGYEASIQSWEVRLDYAVDLGSELVGLLHRFGADEMLSTEFVATSSIFVCADN